MLVVAGSLPTVEAGLVTHLLGRFSITFVTQERPANSYRTDLWDMEFQERADKQRADQEAELKQPALDQGIKTAAGIIARQLEGGAEDWGPIPGQVHLTDMTQETPFAEWQVNKSAAEHVDHYAGGPTAWVMSRVRAKGSRFSEDLPTANGPSMLTLLVAIIACMVMAGALFAEK